MADAATHEQKSRQTWELAQKLLENSGPGFLTINQAMYAIGHLLEYHLAMMHMHPSAAARGVPHSERGRLARQFLLPAGILSEDEMALYERLFAQRDTFCDGGLEDPKFVRSYVSRAEMLLRSLRAASAGRK